MAAFRAEEWRGQRCSCCQKDNIVKLHKSGETMCCRAKITWKLLEFTHPSFQQHVYGLTLSESSQRREKQRLHLQTRKGEKKWKAQWKPYIRLHEASLGTGLYHTRILSRTIKHWKLGYCLWHVLKGMATLHLTRSKTKNCYFTK